MLLQLSVDGDSAAVYFLPVSGGHGAKLRPTLERARRGSPHPSEELCTQPASSVA